MAGEGNKYRVEGSFPHSREGAGDDHPGCTRPSPGGALGRGPGKVPQHKAPSLLSNRAVDWVLGGRSKREEKRSKQSLCLCSHHGSMSATWEWVLEAEDDSGVQAGQKWTRLLGVGEQKLE